MKKPAFFLSFFLLILFARCSAPTHSDLDPDVLYSAFQDPPAEARPFVRWWWNGNHLEEEELIREIHLLKEAGFGGVEINPIAKPGEASDLGIPELKWLGEEWNKALVLAAKELKKEGMIADMIVGSGWPFGGEFVSPGERIQRVISHSIFLEGGRQFTATKDELVSLVVEQNMGAHILPDAQAELLFAYQLPDSVEQMTEAKELGEEINQTGILELQVPAVSQKLVIGVLLRGHREVLHGATGAAGPVMNHYDRNVTRAYLDRLLKISEDTGIPLKELLRALFCDSIELSGANWTDGFQEIFFESYGYRLEPYYPFIFYHPVKGYEKEGYPQDLGDELKRVRYDFNSLLVKEFLDNFTRTFQEFCSENGLLCRYQAYGTPFLMGMLEGYTIPDIPESNNWIYSADMEGDEWAWSQNHGYMIWNMYAASGGHLTGRKIISCEAMTNTRGVFKASLEDFKQADDMNFITGMNHSILHGFNYSPPEAGFPGWLRYGAYFNEQNTWWPYLPNWLEYNARLSAVFQLSKPSKSVAIIAPAGDLWGEVGLSRGPFHVNPWYGHRLWEGLSQAGSSCDYINEGILQQAQMKGGRLNYGEMSYGTLILASVESLEPETALALNAFVESGGKLVFLDKAPSRSLSLKDAAKNDLIVRETINTLLQKQTDRVRILDGPEDEQMLLSWTKDLISTMDMQQDVIMDNPDKNVFQIHERYGSKDLYFFVNSNRAEPRTFRAVFPTEGKTPWIWNPEDGSREPYLFGEQSNDLEIRLKPLQSMLLVFEPHMEDGPEVRLRDKQVSELSSLALQGSWKMHFEHQNGHSFDRELDMLGDITVPGDADLDAFAGTITYSVQFNAEGTEVLLDLGEVNKGITEVELNGIPLGLNWYGKPEFDTKRAIHEGENTLVIHYTSILANYSRSLDENATAQKWAGSFETMSNGLEGPVLLIR